MKQLPFECRLCGEEFRTKAKFVDHVNTQGHNLKKLEAINNG